MNASQRSVICLEILDIALSRISRTPSGDAVWDILYGVAWDYENGELVGFDEFDEFDEQHEL